MTYDICEHIPLGMNPVLLSPTLRTVSMILSLSFKQEVFKQEHKLLLLPPWQRFNLCVSELYLMPSHCLGKNWEKRKNERKRNRQRPLSWLSRQGGIQVQVRACVCFYETSWQLFRLQLSIFFLLLSGFTLHLISLTWLKGNKRNRGLCCFMFYWVFVWGWGGGWVCKQSFICLTDVKQIISTV